MFGSAGGLTGGAERFALELARHMADVTPTMLLSFGDEERRETIGRLSVRVAGRPWYVRGQRSNPLSPAILSEIRRADVVHCHQQHIVASTVAALVCRVIGRRVFASPLGGGGWDVSGYVRTDRWYHGRLHLSEYSRRIYGSDRGSRVIFGGVDVERFAPPAKRRRARYGALRRAAPAAQGGGRPHRRGDSGHAGGDHRATERRGIRV